MSRLGAYLTLAALLMAFGACSEPADSPAPYPTSQSHVLAIDTSGGWVNVDFLIRDSMLIEARRCVESRPDAEAVSCFGFASREAYRAAEPTSSGSFTNLCWEVRWQRNKLGDVSADTLSSFQRGAACPEE